MTVLDDADGNSETGSAGGPRSDEIPAPNHPSLRQHSMAHAQLVTPVQRKNINLKRLIEGQRNSMQCTEFGIIYPLLGHVQAGAKQRCDGYFSRLNWALVASSTHSVRCTDITAAITSLDCNKTPAQSIGVSMRRGRTVKTGQETGVDNRAGFKTSKGLRCYGTFLGHHDQPFDFTSNCELPQPLKFPCREARLDIACKAMSSNQPASSQRTFSPSNFQVHGRRC